MQGGNRHEKFWAVFLVGILLYGKFKEVTMEKDKSDNYHYKDSEDKCTRFEISDVTLPTMQ